MKIALLGDVAPFGRYCLRQNPNVLSKLESVAKFLRGHDVVIANLETPFVDGDKAVGSKSAHVFTYPDNVNLLKYLGVTHASLANNHIGDYGLAGYLKTKSTLEGAGISWFGTEGRSMKLEVNGEKISLLGYCSLNTNPSRIISKGKNELNLLDVEKVILEMEDSHKNGYLPILAVHSGQEHVHMPSSEDVKFARGLAEKFDYVYYGHHPHVVQGVEKIKNSPLFYSLGNFIFDDVYTPRDTINPLIRLSEANKTGIIITIEVVGGRVKEWSITPIYMGEHGLTIGDEVEAFHMEQYNKLLDNACSDEYDNMRSAKTREFIEGRYALRNFKWYMNRMNFNSVGILLAARRNRLEHSAIFTSKLHMLKD